MQAGVSGTTGKAEPKEDAAWHRSPATGQGLAL